MGLNICPAAVVEAPVDTVWELLDDPTLYDLWWNARAVRYVPEGKASPGQVVYAKAGALGIEANANITIEMVNPEKHQIQFTVITPLGVVNHQTTTCTAIDAITTRVQFG